MPEEGAESLLPYRDTKPVGAADFYFAINATFRFILGRFGEEGLRAYWRDLGEQYRAPVARTWRRLGLPGIAAYWREFFAAEPGAEVSVTAEPDRVVLDVAVCPAIRRLHEGGREIVPCFCQHCYFAGEATARRAGFTVRVEGGNGACRQTFYPAAASIPPQDIARIAEAT
jgi:hypothetical protein